MGQPTDDSKSKILLDPELNPIMNPLLSAHMGRWAEVYFTSPPEKREQAVADLVRELSRDAEAASGGAAGLKPEATAEQKFERKIDNTLIHQRRLDTEIEHHGDERERDDWRTEEVYETDQRMQNPRLDDHVSEVRRIEGSGIQDSGIEDSRIEDSQIEDSQIEDRRIEDRPTEDRTLEDNSFEEHRAGGEHADDQPIEVPGVEGYRIDDQRAMGEYSGDGDFFEAPKKEDRPVEIHPRLEEVEEQETERGGQELKAENLIPPSAASRVDESAISDVSICETCGHLNTADQRFCGMCGSVLANTGAPTGNAFRLRENGGSNIAASSEMERMDETGTTEKLESPSLESPSKQQFAYPGFDQRSHRRGLVFEPASEPANASPHNASAFEEKQLLQGNPRLDPVGTPSFSSYGTPPAGRNYRLYIGLIVLVLLGLLVYIAWRNNSGNRTDPSALPSAVPDSSPQPEPSGKPSSPSTSTAPATVTPSGAGQSGTSKASTNASPSIRENGEERTVLAESAKRSPKPNPVPASAVESTLNDQYGAEELATAQKYLQAGPNNAALAIPWLWKAVAKENPNAPLILSDLYLRGDGVPKSCDQARVLLRAAARKGGWTAADRLRKLPDFGCQ